MGAILVIIGRFLLTYSIAFVRSAVFMKAVVIGCFVTILPIVLQKVIVWLFDVLSKEMLVRLGSHTDYTSSLILQMNGLAGYLASQTNLIGCFTVIVTALAIRLTLNFIPFIG